METDTNLAELLHSLKKAMRFKSPTAAGDCILVGMPAGLFFGIVHSIDPDIKKNWYRLRFTLLAIPPADITWIVRPPQMNGEIFTINNDEHFVIAVDTSPARCPSGGQTAPGSSGRPSHLKLAKK